MFNLDAIKEQLKSAVNTNKGGFSDPNEWKLAKDKEGNGNAVIRLLPNKDINKAPVVAIYEHNIWITNPMTGKRRGYTEKSPQTIGLPCPVSEAYYLLNASNIKEYKELAKTIGRTRKYVSNIYVIKDPQNPDNEGKVFYWKFGQKLMDKIMSAIEPSDNLIASGIKPVNVFDPINGANFNVIFTKTKFIGNYDNSFFTPPSPLFPNMTEEQVMQFIQENCFDLEKEFLAPETFKSYDELKKEFHRVVSGTEIEKALIELGFFEEAFDEPGNPNKKIKTNTQVNTQVTQTNTQIQQTQPTQNIIQNQPANQTSQANQPQVNQQTQPAHSSDDDIDSLLDDILND